MLVPLKAFGAAKARLAPALDAEARAELAERMAAQVVAAAWPLPVVVACDDEGVSTWATAAGAEVVWAPGTDLNGAVEAGVAWLREQGFTFALVTHADLPKASALAALASFAAGITLVPDRREDGTNVLGLPLTAATEGFAFAYGPGSFARHLAEARERVGIDVRIARLPDLQWDVDVPDDLL
ncbi:MAG: 2-phospho-L-lactate/phosphoenolpyruvate guanylyltransferase [Actinomycetota bacterium]|nr:2-phospho-L-lactate/phosphoenolpyruvate guanylyltransferase [Actinomycetota bacterium]